MKSRSLRARLTLWYTLVLLVILCLFGVDVWWLQGRLGLRRLDRELDGVAATLGNIVDGELREEVAPSEAADEATREVGAPGRSIAVLTPEGRPLAATWGELQIDPPSLVAEGARPVRTAETPRGAWRVHAERRTLEGRPLVLVAAMPQRDVGREQDEVQEAMIVGIPIALVLAAAGGLWLAAVGLRPISEMARQASRMPIAGFEEIGDATRRDELGQLARAFNDLVARLRGSLQAQRQFMADASHELRTPVSIIRTAADVSLRREGRDEAHYRDTLAIVDAQARRLSRLVADMLVLARADAGGYTLRPVNLYLEELVWDCRRAVEVLAAERGVVVAGGPWPEIPCRGDEDLLRQLVLNVLQNAVQHTPAGGRVEIEVTRRGDTATVRVTDSGPGIPTADRERIFDRFVQLDPARRGSGTGLGLPIAKWIAEAHHGSLMLEQSGPSGSTFAMSLPVG